MLVAKTRETVHIGKAKNTKRVKTNDNNVLEQIWQMMKANQPQHGSGSEEAHQRSTEDVLKAKVEAILQCSICLNTAKLPAALCTMCHRVMGCVPCIEQWHESSK